MIFGLFFGINDKNHPEFIWKNDKNTYKFVWKNDKVLVSVLKMSIFAAAISNPKFPLIESARKNLLKLYLNDVGLLTGLLYGDNLKPILDDVRSINLGTVYESVVAQELKAHGHTLYYYDNKQNGEVDFMIDDFRSLSVLPIEIKSGKDYSVHSALSHFVSNEEYTVNQGFVLYQEREFKAKGRILYVPVYFSMFL